MKKALVGILAFLYIIITCGVVVNLHYCMGKRAAVTLGYDSNEGCGKCGMKNNKGCCHDEFKVIKLQESHQPAVYDLGLFAGLACMVPSHTGNTAVLPKLEFLSQQYHSPPDPRLNTVYLQNCVFRI